MLKLMFEPSPHCEGHNRREFIQLGALAGLGVSLPDVLRLQALITLINTIRGGTG